MTMNYSEQKIKKEWIQNGIDDPAVVWAESFGKFLQTDDSSQRGSKPLTTSQVRKFFGELKKIQSSPDKFRDDIPLLKAKLAYAVGRETKVISGKRICQTKIKEFYEELETGINLIRKGNSKDLNNFVKLVEAIVAYHKYYGGKDI